MKGDKKENEIEQILNVKAPYEIKTGLLWLVVQVY